MEKAHILLCFAILLFLTGICHAQPAENQSQLMNFWKCTSPTKGFFGLNEKLAPVGIEFAGGLTNLYQANVKGGISTNQHRGRYVGRYDLEMSTDLEKLLGLKGSFFIRGWGGWPDEEGIDSRSVASAFGVDALAIGNRSLDIVEAFYEGPLFGDNLTIAIGKLDFTGIFDQSLYADDECCQFLNGAFVDDPTIPFPQQGLGTVLNWHINENWYLMGGLVDAQADSREAGFDTTFGGEDYFFYALETGVKAGNDNYRLGIWNDPQPKANTDLAEEGKSYRDDVGVYTSCDWLVYKENPSADDTQGLGMFARYGYAPSKTNDITNFFSAGFQYQGLFDGRDDDVLGVGYARGTFAKSASVTYPEDYEAVFETYYNIKVTPWFVFGPDFQYVTNPGGSGTSKDAIVLGIRAAITF